MVVVEFGRAGSPGHTFRLWGKGDRRGPRIDEDPMAHTRPTTSLFPNLTIGTDPPEHESSRDHRRPRPPMTEKLQTPPVMGALNTENCM